ncbi:PAS domain-containing sensor histidine kinase [Rhizobium leguminosarum]|uniref:PAS domain-containing sensor histidine kinase n=1 Tax=Rhizobium leguminosarum TaxID=384 RepID=UPI001C90FE11|nr:PAS domain-containing sensor histidine kinase [Rhizobium leguminosarum]MBY2918801.1 PAS domain S-box protein [Rhizobium leguminosarum]MBY2974449.1 PAS domain S-box protein [Rhizobium leguminosarum]MBY2981931.1 PAS domain S-box protein [Rhizobium leguminosarum]MBY3010398.1 PAS domain S-box protein [Rhizobium leguminosarum]
MELGRVLDTLPGMVFSAYPDGRIDFVNKSLAEITGSTEGWPKRGVWPLAAPPSEATDILRNWRVKLSLGEPFEVAVPIRCKDGKVVLALRCNPLRKNGKIAKWYGSAVDVTTPKIDPVRGDNYFQRVVDSIPVPVAVTTPAGDVEGLNQPALDYFGMSLEELQGWKATEVVHPDDLRRTMNDQLEAHKTGTFYNVESRHLRSDGAYRWHNVLGLPLRDVDGTILRWFHLLVDIEDSKNAQKALVERERESRFIVDGIAGMIAIFSPDGALIGGNQQILDYFQLPLNELNNWATNGITHPDDLQVCIDSFMGSIITGEPYDYETRFLRSDGVYRWFQLRGLPLRDAEGTIVRWYGLLTDIDDRKRAEERQRRSEASLADAQRLSKTGSFSLNFATNEILWSAETYRIFDIETSMPITLEAIMSRLDTAGVATVQDVINRSRETSGDFDYELRLFARDGSAKNVRVLAHSERNEEGQQELTGAIQDVTEGRLAEEALNEARSQLSYVTRVTSLGVLTASIAHEVNQPLAGIVANASTCLRVLVADQPNIELAKDTARRMVRDANRAAEVIVRLRALFSRKPASVEALNMNDVASEVLSLALSDLQRRRVSIFTEFDRSLPRVSGARVQLQQVIMNLIRNSIEALESVQQRPRRLTLRTTSLGEEIVLSVRDNGTGFGPDGPHNIFDAFYTTKSEGMGIGLSVSRTIVENHSGRIWASPEEDGGVTVSFALPVYQAKNVG